MYVLQVQPTQIGVTVKFVSASITPNLPYVESLTVCLTNYEADLIVSALKKYAQTASYYDVAADNLAADLQRHIAQGVYAEQLDRIMNTGHFDDNLRDGKMITVVKFLRGATDCGLAAAKHAADRRKEALNI